MSKETKTVEKKIDIDKEVLSDAQATKKILDSEEQVHFMVPLSEGEKAGAVHDCFINGYKYSVPKGTMTIVPQSIASLLANYYKVNMEAGADSRVDLSTEKLNALG